MDEPVTFAMFAAHQRLGSDASEQAVIEGYIVTAREWVEDHTGHILAQREVVDHANEFGPRLKLSKRPVVEVVSIDYIDGAGASIVYAESDIRFDGRFSYVHAAPAGWPSGYRAGSITVRYLAGFAPIEVPQRFIMAILVLAADLYRNRSGGFSPDAERAARGLLRSFRNHTL